MHAYLQNSYFFTPKIPSWPCLDLSYSWHSHLQNTRTEVISSIREKFAQCIFANIKSRVSRPARYVNLYWRRRRRDPWNFWFTGVIRTSKFSNIFNPRSLWLAPIIVFSMYPTAMTPRIGWWTRSWSWPWSVNMKYIYGDYGKLLLWKQNYNEHGMHLLPLEYASYDGLLLCSLYYYIYGVRHQKYNLIKKMISICLLC